MWIIYKITHKESGRSYIGLTGGTIKKRWEQHVIAAQSSKRVSAIQRAIAKHGPEAFKISVITECVSEHEASICERGIIAAHGTYAKAGGYNLTLGGETPGGRAMRFDDRKCLSELLKGRKKKMSPEGSAKLAAAAKARFGGKKHSAERVEKFKRYIADDPKARANRAKGGAGRVWSKEARENMSESVRAAHAKPEVQAKISAAIKASYLTSGAAKIISEKKKAWHANPENKERFRENARSARLRYLEKQRAAVCEAQGDRS